MGKEATSVRYREVSHLAALKDWRFLYFGQGAYIIPVSAFRDAAELDRFDTFITGKCGMPIVILEGKYPRADGTQEGEETDAGVRAYFHC
ncbi:YcxB family protein [Flavonifractor plautii]|nr:YcxB family protein [Flavonifractor plautii]